MQSDHERVMRESFQSQARGIVREPARFVKSTEKIVIGVESELGVVSTNDETSWRARDAVVSLDLDVYDVELGRSQIELRTDPVNIRGAGAGTLLNSYRDRTQRCLEVIHEHGSELLRCGSNPFLPVRGAQRSDRPKYQQVPDFHNTHRRPTINTLIGNLERVDVGDASIISLFQAFQPNIQADSLDDATDKMNRSFGISPFLVALAGNARYLECRDTGYNDVRTLAWEISHDTRTAAEVRSGLGLRVGLPESYFDSADSYFERIARYPFILFDPERALQVGIGTHWLDARVKIIGDSAIVELRSLPTQPTIEDEVFLMLWYLGRLIFSQRTKEQLLPLSFVSENRLSAMTLGLSGELWISYQGRPIRVNARYAVLEETKNALWGLERLEIESSGLVEWVQERIRNGSPSDQLTIDLHASMVSEDAMKHSLRKLHMLI